MERTLVPLDTVAIARDDDTSLVPLRPCGGALTRLVCGYLACDRGMRRPLLKAFPRALRVPVGDAGASAPLRELLRELPRVGIAETAAAPPGSRHMLAQLAELMFAETLRRHVERLALHERGWLAGLRDSRIGRALALLHAQARKAWTVDSLAREVGLSRSALAERFAALVGEPPIRYLTRWRLAAAARSLRGGDEAVWRVAERSGYESEAAFNRAFKREFGLPPAAWRKAGQRAL
jgi:AraC-like DNA-binding protein